MADHSTGELKEGKYALPEDLYNVLVKVIQLGLPGAGALYYSLASIWGFPYGDEVVGSLAAIALFLGIILAISKASYKNSVKAIDGVLVVDTVNPLKDNYSFEVTTPLEDLPSRNTITLQVKAPSQ